MHSFFEFKQSTSPTPRRPPDPSCPHPQEVVAVGSDMGKAAALAHAMSEIGSPPPGSEGDASVVSRSERFCAEIVESGGLPMLLHLVKSAPDPNHKMEGRRRAREGVCELWLCFSFEHSRVVLSCVSSPCSGLKALHPMCLYGNQATHLALMAKDVITLLVDCTKGGGAAGGGDQYQTLACQALSGMTRGLGEPEKIEVNVEVPSPEGSGLPPKTETRVVVKPAGYRARKQIFGSFLGLLSSKTEAGEACRCITSVASASPDCYIQLEEQGAIPKVVELIRDSKPSAVMAPLLLLCGLVRWSPDASTASVKAGADGALTKVMGECDLATKVVCCACCGFIIRHNEKAREKLGREGLLAHLLDVAQKAPCTLPHWEEAMVALSLMVRAGVNGRGGYQ